jgi:hypothetical protein
LEWLEHIPKSGAKPPISSQKWTTRDLFAKGHKSGSSSPGFSTSSGRTGYQLTEDIGNLPFPGPIPDSAAVYRMLRELEKTDLVRSEWEHGEVGPSKRVYSITPQGEERLDVWVKALGERVKMLNHFISLCEKSG